MKTNKNHFNPFELSKDWQFILSFLALIIAAFGQPVRSPLMGFFAASFGYAIFWRVLLCYQRFKERFLLSLLWFSALQLVQLSWMTSHPFLYIYLPYFLFAILQGVQFGFLGIFIKLENLTKIRVLFGVAGFWVLMEWSRLFFMSGFSWNPVGMALTVNVYSLQMASLFGVYGLSFLVIFVNLIGLKCFIDFKLKRKWVLDFCVYTIVFSVPYVYGVIHLQIHDYQSDKNSESFNAVLVQPSFAVDGTDHIRDRKVLVHYVMNQWKKILEITKKHQGKSIDLIVLPEYVVSFGTYSTVFPFESVKNVFAEVFSEEIFSKLPPLDEHLADQFTTFQQDGTEKIVTFVNNAFWLQALANVFNASVIAGLEDVDHGAQNERNYYSAALYFSPACINCVVPERYEKRVLVPLGEYIPFKFCQDLAVKYGVTGSFTRGEKAKIFFHPKKKIGPSICYEETFGHVTRENKMGGAELLVNLTNDGWFPGSNLTKQHFDHARLRTVECGIPLIRACNTGLTGGVDSLGRLIALLDHPSENHESLSDSLFVKVPTYSYSTIYSKFGDYLILVISFFGLIFLLTHITEKEV